MDSLASTVSSIESCFEGLPLHCFSSFHRRSGISQHTAVAYGFGSAASMQLAKKVISAEEAGIISSEEVYGLFPRTPFIAVNVGYDGILEVLSDMGYSASSDVHLPSKNMRLFSREIGALYPEYYAPNRVDYDTLPVTSDILLLRPGLEEDIKYVSLELCRGTGVIPDGVKHTDAILSVSISRHGKVFRVNRFDKRRAASLRPRWGDDAMGTIESFASYLARNEQKKSRR